MVDMLFCHLLAAIPKPDTLACSCCCKHTRGIQGKTQLEPKLPSFKPHATLQTQMRKGFQRVEESLEDIALDSPLVKPAFTKYKQQAEQEGWLV